MPSFEFDYISLTCNYQLSYIYNIEAWSNHNNVFSDPDFAPAPIPTSEMGRIQKINFEQLGGDPEVSKVKYSYPNIDFSGMDENSITKLEIFENLSGQIAIKDTDFPPPDSLINRDIFDLSPELHIQKIETLRDGTTGTNFSIEIRMLSKNGKKYTEFNPEYRIEDIITPTGGTVKALILYAHEDTTSGSLELNFSIPAIDFSTISNKKLVLLIIDADPNDIFGLPETLKKKGMIWIK